LTVAGQIDLLGMGKKDQGNAQVIDHNAKTQDGVIAKPKPTETGLPREIGPYRILETLGVGGMGQVLLGQSEIPKRKAAIKLMLGTGLSADAIARFRREMEVLARLEHPGIARLFEVGFVILEGIEQPWYAMEYVPGLPLDVFVKRHQLSVKAILRLVAQIARALHYAHQKGIIHRDIKPANIIVDAQGSPKILDFGIARLSEPEATQDAAAQPFQGAPTRFGQIIGTLAYMSPEQISASASADVRSDVYALGIVLYELLTGELPIRISTTSLLDAIKELTEGRRVALSQMRPNLRGEVELIVDTATNREIHLRYSSAESFSDDLENYLTNRPLAAKRPSFGYLFGKFVRRNPTLVGAFALGLVGVLSASAIAVRNAIRAEQALARSEAISGFLRDVLSGANADTATDEAPNVQRLLESSADTLKTRFPTDPLLRVQLRQIIAEGLMGAGQYRSASQQIQLALKEDLSLIPPHALPANLVFGLQLEAGVAARLNSDFVSAEDILRPLIAKPSTDTALNLRVYKELADTLNERSQCAEALKLYQYVVDQAAPAQLEIKTNALSGYASCLGDLGQFAEAARIMKLQLRAEIERFGELNSEPLNTRHNLATLLRQLGELEEAHVQILKAYEGRSRLLGPTQRRTLNSQISLAAILRVLKREQEALPIARDALEKFRATLGANAPETRTACDGLANIELSALQREAALNTWRACLAEANSFDAWNTAETIKMRNGFGMASCVAKEQNTVPLASDQQSALLLLRETLDAATQLWSASNFQTARVEANLGVCLAAISKSPNQYRATNSADAARHLSHAIEILSVTVANNDPQLIRAKAALSSLE
jgi:eukaryotic-like serine/threonine-protein kinase